MSFRFTKGPKLLVDSLNRVLEEVDAVTVQPSPTVNVKRSSSGTILTAAGSSPTVNRTPYQGQDASDTTAGKVRVVYGTHNDLEPTINGTRLLPPIGTPVPVLTLANTDTAVYVEVDFAFDSSGTISSYSGAVINSGSSTPPNVLTFSSDGSGTGKLYQTLFGVAVATPVGNGPYVVSIGQNLFTSMSFQVCASGIVTSPVSP